MKMNDEIGALVLELDRKQRVTIDKIDNVNARIDSISDKIREINSLCNDVKSTLN
ncbi:hypothetical protein MJ749_25335 [Paenibacillus polymyxa]|uniref:hypothetical protein n=1 Tax=Paenibacillus polymyxa TaxID=1406 RepID=UPI001F0F2EEB|nr:hypothetical protein [Paenibacillus polymyxa]UMR35906.1 hypothetical protein MJ749_25335 [Paenibacillus polymyxa]